MAHQKSPNKYKSKRLIKRCIDFIKWAMPKPIQVKKAHQKSPTPNQPRSKEPQAQHKLEFQLDKQKYIKLKRKVQTRSIKVKQFSIGERNTGKEKTCNHHSQLHTASIRRARRRRGRVERPRIGRPTTQEVT